MDKNCFEAISILNNFKRTLRVVKTSVFLLFFGIIYSQATNSFSQELTLHMKSTSIKEICKEIERKSEYIFVFSDNSERTINKQVNVDVVSKNINDILDYILVKNDLDYKVIDKQIVVYKSNESYSKIKVSNNSATTQQQSKRFTFTGVVLDNSGETLPGVNICLKSNRSIGTTTDENGRFRISISSEKDVLIFTFIGMKNREINLTPEMAKELKITLQSTDLELDEYVVTGYQNIDKRHLTSAITSVSAEDVLVPGMTSIDQALEGRIPELSLISNSGEVGSTPRIRVRGTSTLLGNREPLWVLDGFIIQDPVKVSNDELNDPDYINLIGNAIAGINPQDIDRIDVLKDASATALYGTRAANGVVVVTTKKGVEGAPTVSFNHSTKITQRPRYTDKNINLMNSFERMDFGKDLIDIHYQFPSNMPLVGYEGASLRYYKGQTSFDEFTKEVQWYESANTDWFRYLTREAISTDNTVSISGGSGSMRYYGSMGFNPEQGVSIGTNTNRYTSRANLDFTLFKNLRVNYSIAGNTQNKDHLSSDINAMDYAYNTTRTLPMYNNDGSLHYYDKIGYNGMNQASKMYRYNILNEINNSSNVYDGSSINTNLTMRYKVSKNLDVSLAGSYSSNSTTQEQWWGERSHYIARLRNGEVEDAPRPGEAGHSELPYGGVLKTATSRQESFTARAQANYRTSFGENKVHMITAMGGFEMNSGTYKSISDENRGFIKDRGLQFIDQIDLDEYPYYKSWINKNHRGIAYDISRQISGYSTIGYSYRNHFTLNANARIDASNKFGSNSNEKMLPVWSVSGMVNFKDVLLKDLNFISDLRMRGSFGLQGNMLDDQSPNLIIKQGTINPQYNENVSWIARYPNPNLLWEQTSQYNVSMDAAFFKNRLSIRGTYYYKKTKDAFTSVKISSVNGVSGDSYVMNGGDLENKGYSISLSVQPVKTRDFMWRMSTYYSGNLNKVKTNEVETYRIDDYLNGTALVNNMPVNSFFSYKYLGLNPENGSPVFDDYNDRRHLLDGKSLEEVMMMVTKNSGQREPKFHGSLSNSFKYKNINLSMNITYSVGSMMRLFPMFEPINRGVSAEHNIRKEFLDRWMKPGDEAYTNIPSIMSPSHPDYYNNNPHYSNVSSSINKFPKFADNVWTMYDKSEERVVSGDYIKLSSLSLSYSFAKKLLNDSPLKSARISFNTINLFTISAKELKGQDPTQAGFAKPGLSVRPTYTMQFNVSF